MSARVRDFDVVIVGQGLAGTTLAWTLIERGMTVLVVDRGEACTTSRIAAGMLTPVTGPRLAKTWGWDESWRRAVEFYQRIEQRLATPLFEIGESVRIFPDARERDRFAQRIGEPDFAALVHSAPLELPVVVQAPYGGFTMQPTARLQVTRYLDASRREFEQLGMFIHHDLNVDDLQLEPDGCVIPSLKVKARRVVFCQGYVPHPPAWFQAVRFVPAKGEILTVKIPELQETRSLHSLIWVAPLGDSQYAVGATAEWQQLDNLPTPAGRAELLSKLAEIVNVPAVIVEHRAAVRPVSHDFRPMVGWHPDVPQLGMLNGLGAKGSLYAPRLSELLADNLLQGKSLPPELDVQRWFR